MAGYATGVGARRERQQKYALDMVQDQQRMQHQQKMACVVWPEQILALLDAPAPDVELETCGNCMGSGYGGHPDSGAVCFKCDGSGGVAPAPAGVTVQEAAKVLLGDECSDTPLLNALEPFNNDVDVWLDVQSALRALSGDRT
jgi:hypothetical protein